MPLANSTHRVILNLPDEVNNDLLLNWPHPHYTIVCSSLQGRTIRVITKSLEINLPISSRMIMDVSTIRSVRCCPDKGGQFSFLRFNHSAFLAIVQRAQNVLLFGFRFDFCIPNRSCYGLQLFPL